MSKFVKSGRHRPFSFPRMSPDSSAATSLEPSDLLPHEILVRNSREVAFVVDSYLVNFLYGRGTAATISSCGRAVTKLAARVGRVNSLVVFGPDAQFSFSAEHRAALRNMVSANFENYRAAAFVIGDGGFRASAARSLITAINMATRAQHPTRVFAELSSSVAWLESHRPPADPQRMNHLLRTIRVLSETD